MVHGNEVKAVDGVNTCSGEIESLRAECDALALRVANLERIGREIVDVADAEKLPAFSCFQDMNDALKSTGTGAGAVRRDASATNAAERAVVEAARLETLIERTIRGEDGPDDLYRARHERAKAVEVYLGVLAGRDAREET